MTDRLGLPRPATTAVQPKHGERSDGLPPDPLIEELERDAGSSLWPSVGAGVALGMLGLTALNLMLG